MFLRSAKMYSSLSRYPLVLNILTLSKCIVWKVAASYLTLKLKLGNILYYYKLKLKTNTFKDAYDR